MEEQNNSKRVPEDSDRKRRIAVLIAVGAAAVLLLGGYVGLCAYAGNGGGRMAPNTLIGGVEVGSLPVEEAVSTLDAALQQRLSALEVDFYCQGNRYSVPGTEFSYDAEGLVKSVSPGKCPSWPGASAFWGGCWAGTGPRCP